MQRQKIISALLDMAGRYSSYEVFSDWIRCMALTISNSLCMTHDKLWHDREKAFLDTYGKYTKDEQTMFSEMFAWLAESLDNGPDDVLGSVYMMSGMGSKAAGQFFTPFHLAEMAARTGLEDSIKPLREEMTTLPIYEPACGGGAMIIAAAKVLRDEGINYQRVMRVTAQDLDWKGVYMCYVQLSLLGINAVCIQGNTLDGRSAERRQKLFTPAWMGALV